MSTSDSHPEFGVYVPDVTLAVARSAGGGITGLTVTALDGSIAHGNRIRIEADASYAIGPKAQAAPKMWAMGSEMIVDGMAQTAETVGGSIDTTNLWSGGSTSTDYLVVENDSPRHVRASQFYRMRGKAEIKGTKAFDALAKADAEKLAFFARYKTGSKFQGNRIFNCENVVGTFAFPDTRARGEVCDITTADGLTTLQVYITFIDPTNSFVTVEPIGFSWGSGAPGTSDFFGGTLAGATATLDISVSNATRDTSSVKFIRFDQNGGRTDEAYLTYSDNSNGQFFNGSYVSGVQQNSPHIFINQGSPADNPGAWQLVGLVADYSGAASKVDLRLGNAWAYNENSYDVSGFQSASTGFGPTSFGMETNNTGISYSQVGIGMDLGEIYIDNDTRMLWLCDAATFAASIDMEPLRPDEWTENPDGSVVIDAYLYQGAFSDLTGKYLALTAGSTVIFEGVAI